MFVKTLPYPEEARAIRLDYNGPRWTAPHEVQLLCWLSQHTHGAILELGCNEGRTLRELALANPGRYCIGVDYSGDSGMCREQQAERPPIDRIGFYAKDLGPMVSIHDQRSCEYLSHLRWPPLGFIFIDGNHSESGVSLDSNAGVDYFRKRGGSGLIVWHDCYDDGPPWVKVKGVLAKLENPIYRYADTCLAWTFVTATLWRKLLGGKR
jgi:hypothetical protein